MLNRQNNTQEQTSKKKFGVKEIVVFAAVFSFGYVASAIVYFVLAK